jgi:hypothetical protein
MERRGSRLSRRAFVLGAAGLGLLAGDGRLSAPPLFQTSPPFIESPTHSRQTVASG